MIDSPRNCLVRVGLTVSHWVMGIVGLLIANCAVAQPPSSSWASSQSSIVVSTLKIGIDGHYRVGCWTAVNAAGIASGSEPIGIETLDGDGVRVVYEQSAEFSGSGTGYVVPGMEAAPLIIRQADKILLSSRFPTIGVPAVEPSMIPLGMPWVLVIGDPLGIDTIGENELLARPASVAVTQPKSGEEFPRDAIGYEGVDLVVLSGSGTALLKQFSPAQQAALGEWLFGGGRMLLSLGESTTTLFDAAPWLIDLLPKNFGEVRTIAIDPSALESFTSTQVPLQSFTGIDLPRELGQVVVLGRTTRKVSTPVASDYVVGLGRVTVIAADLDAKMFADWPERLALVTRLTSDVLTLSDNEPASQSQATSYSDLAGQMRIGLDRFAIKRRFSFSLISLILLALIALVGPLDYLFVNRVLGRPLLGWLSFPLVAIGLSAVLIWQSLSVTNVSTSSASGPAATTAATDVPVQCNRIEFVDIDAAAGVGRGFVWSYIYTHEARQIALQSESTSALQSIAVDVPQQLLSAFGYPGRALGGIQIVGDDSRMPAYKVQLVQQNEAMTGSMVELALAPRSSKSIATRYQFKPQLPADLSVARRRGSELLEGSITNPFEIDLLDGMLIYRNWAYLLPTRFRAGATVASLDSLRQKNFRWQLSRQRAIESSSESEAWNANEQQPLDRIAEMLMFHDAVGGRRYTKLDHDVLGELDLSRLLVDDRCLLVGRLDSPLSRLSIAAHADAAVDADEATRSAFPETESLTLLRLLIPIRTTSRY